VGWFSSVWHAVTHPGQLVSDGEHLLGQVTDQGAHLVGRGLTDIGLGQVGNVVDGWGDDAANDLDPELQLGQTDDPTQLIHGSPGAIRQTASNLHQFSGAFGETASGLAGIDTSHWTGSAADAFHAKYAPQPPKWRDASTASGDAGGALESYAGTVEWAQGQAREAISLYAQGQKATQAAMTAYNSQVNAYNAAAKTYDAKLSAGQNPGPTPTEPAAFSDPGASMREHAQEILSTARAERDRAGSAAASTVSKATDLAPVSPGLWSQVGDTFTDGVQFDTLAQASFDSGIITGVADIGKFVRSVNPTDPWNIQHPAEYLAGLSGTAAGLVHDAVHPQDLVGQVLGGGWGSDPFEAAGKLVPQVALALATDGGGTAADAGTDAGVDAGADAGSDLSGAGNDPAASGQTPGDQNPAVDPVDVTTGSVLLYQTDVKLEGSLPLTIKRSHRSAFPGGRWFGRRWASTLDQRLQVSPQGVFVSDDEGSILCYPHPNNNGEPAWPVAGRRWPLQRHGDAYTVTDPQSGITRRFEPRSGFYLSAQGYGEMPLVSVTSRAGQQITFTYTLDGAPESVAHDGGYLIRVLTSGRRVAALLLARAGDDGQDVPLAAYRYDQRGNLAEVFNSSGTPLRFTHDQAGRLTSWTDRNGFTYSYAYDDQGRCVFGEGPGGTMSGTLTYDRENMVTTVTDAGGGVTVYQITPQSTVAAITNPLGDTTRSDHDSCGRLVMRGDPLGRTTRWAYDQHGNLTAVTRPDGSQATAEYNQQNLPTVITEPGGGSWRQDYDQAGNLLWQQAPDGAVTRYAYDHRGHLAAVTDALGAVTRMECNPAGLPVAVASPDGAITQYERDTLGHVIAITAPDGSVTRQAWTLEGQLARRVLPDGTIEQFSYDGEGNLTSHLDPASRVTTLEYSCFDKLAAHTAPNGTRVEFHYDCLLRLTTVSLADGHDTGGHPHRAKLTWRYEYDATGNLIAETDYNGATSRYTRDAAGQLTRTVDAAGQQISNTHDLLGNVIERDADGVVTRFGYDPAGGLMRAETSDVLLEFERDDMGRVTAETCNGRTVMSSYNAAGQRVRRITPSGAQTRWAYDAVGRPVRLSSAGQELRFGYDLAGRETTRELPGGTLLAHSWNTAGRLTAQVLTAGLAARVLQRRGYQYRADGVLVGLDDLLSGPRRLTVDPAGRVTGVAGPDWAERYVYDPAGNITAAIWPPPPGTASTWAGSGAQGPRQYAGTLITGAGDIRYQHDACGRITLRQRVRDSRKPDSWRYQWDADDHLTAVTTPDGTNWRYLYDPLGRRIAKQRLDAHGQAAEQTNFIWDGSLLAEQATTVAVGADGGLVTTWDYRPGTFTAVTQVTKPESATCEHASQDQIDGHFYAIVTDLIGAPSELVAPDGDLAGYQQRTLWGTTLWHPEGASTPLRFPGQYADDETGLHYNYHRYYDPATGRYLTPDPLGLLPAPNPHAYVANPITRTDPLGLMDPCEDGLTYEPSPKHGLTQRGDAAPAPTNGQQVLERYSTPIKSTTTRRVGVDPTTGEYDVFDETYPGSNIFHGHARSWGQLTQDMRNALIRAGYVNRRGNILIPPPGQ
jgi:RHS repeat-associated protein